MTTGNGSITVSDGMKRARDGDETGANAYRIITVWPDHIFEFSVGIERVSINSLKTKSPFKVEGAFC